jgi:NarL family two-component system response regulator LiaR
LYGISLALLLFLLKWPELHFLLINHAFEVYIGAIAIIFTALGIWLALKLMRPKIQTVFVEKEIYKNEVVEKDILVYHNPDFTLTQKELKTPLGVSKRELEVLQLMAEGLSNQEIA